MSLTTGWEMDILKRLPGECGTPACMPATWKNVEKRFLGKVIHCISAKKPTYFKIHARCVLSSHYTWLKWTRSSWIIHQNVGNLLLFSNSVVTWTSEHVFYDFGQDFLTLLEKSQESLVLRLAWSAAQNHQSSGQDPVSAVPVAVAVA